MKALARLTFAVTSCLSADPGLASMCVAFQPDQFADLNWSGSEHYDSYTGSRILAAMQVIDGRAVIDLDLVGVPKVDELYAMPVGKQVLLIRVRGTLVCADDPITLDVWQSALFWVMPGAA